MCGSVHFQRRPIVLPPPRPFYPVLRRLVATSERRHGCERGSLPPASLSESFSGGSKSRLNRQRAAGSSFFQRSPMKSQRTLEDLKRRGDKAFAETQAAIDTTRRIAARCRELNAELRRARDDDNSTKRTLPEL